MHRQRLAMKKKQEAEQAQSKSSAVTTTPSPQPNAEQTAQSVESPSTRPQVEDSAGTEQ